VVPVERIVRMLSDSEKRAALLAVSRYGADSSRVFLVVQSVLEMRSQGDGADLLEFFQREKLLTASQARELRFGLEKTLVDPLSKNGSAPPAPCAAETLLPSDPTDEDDAGNAGDLQDLRVLGDYRILRRLGEGGTGSVFLAYHEKENRQVAIKVLSKQLSEKQPALDRFYREAKSGALLNHPNIVRNLAAGQDQQTGLHYLVLEYVDGPSALDLLDKFHRLPVGDALHIVLDIARALEHAHSRSIVHRDIKPGNILITLSGLAKLADMGLAKRTDETSHLTHARQGFGTPYYMPFEQATNAKYADARSDIYALGATLYHLVVGEVPFPGTNSLEIIDKKDIGEFTPASALNADVPRVVDVILAKMLAREPRDRYQTASELIVDLERSNLSAALPSFTDPDRAMQDPVVRQRLAAPAATCPDLRPGVDRPHPEDQTWYLRYQDRHGQTCQTKLTLGQVTQKLRDGKFSPQIEAARFPQGNFQPLATYVEYQEVLQSLSDSTNHKAATKEPAAKAPHLGWWIALGSGAGIVLLLMATLFLWLRGS
jgi:serine/threonine protein kinase